MAKIKPQFAILLLTLTVFFSAQKAEASTLFIKPSQTVIHAGDTVRAQIIVNTQGDNINNAESIIQYPQDLLEVVSLDKGPLFSLWVEEPQFSNSTGQISFNGGIPNPGYTGSSGLIASVVFRAKKAGTASISFLDSAVRANDGLGTDVLTSKNGTDISISAAEAPTPTPVPVKTVPTPSPVITPVPAETPTPSISPVVIPTPAPEKVTGNDVLWLAGIAILLGLLLLSGWIMFFFLWIKTKRQMAAIEKDVVRPFKILKKDVNKHIRKIMKAQKVRKLTDEESEIMWDIIQK